MKKTFFCYLDVLGFKKKLENKSDEDQLRILNALFGCISFSIPESLSFEPNANKGIIDLTSINTNSILISDTLIVWTNDCNNKSIVEFIYRIQRLVRNSFMAGFPLRGTIEYGSIYHRVTTIPTTISYNHFDLIGGNALMNAYQAEENFEWLGCVLSKDCTEQILLILKKDDMAEVFETNNLFKNKVLVEYPAPTKNGIDQNLYTINWIDFIVADYYRKNKITSLFMQHSDAESLKFAQRKIDNTNRYIKYIVDNGWSNQIIGLQEKVI